MPRWEGRGGVGITGYFNIHKMLTRPATSGVPNQEKKSRIRETKHLSTDADSSTDTTVGWTKNSRKPKFFEKRKKSSQTQKLKKV